LLAVVSGLFGCESTQSGAHSTRLAVGRFYSHDYPASREMLRFAAADREDKNVVLNNLRLGMACLADGDLDEAERSLLRAYEYISSGQVNADDRTIASEMLYEGIRVWTGEPYEQAMSHYYISSLYMLRGDWENARAAASNALFSLRDFKDSDPKKGYAAIESEFSLGYLMAATAYVLMKDPEASTRMFDHVTKLKPELKGLVQELKANTYDTLLLVGVGRGPSKQAWGHDSARVRFMPDGRQKAPWTLKVDVDGKVVGSKPRSAAVDLWRLSQFPRWWSLESARRFRSDFGRAAMTGGALTATISRNRDTQLIGLGVLAAGALMRASAVADARHLEMLPRSVFVVPLRLGAGRHSVGLKFQQTKDQNFDCTWHDLVAGKPGEPKVYHLRVHDGFGEGMPKWPAKAKYSVALEDYRSGGPWVLGGQDLGRPTERRMARYQKTGAMPTISFEDYRDAVRAEGVVDRAGPQGRSGTDGLNRDFYRHVTEGGLVWFEPKPGTHQYERIRSEDHGQYVPRSEPLRRIMQRVTSENKGGSDAR
jgi:tetratricopeptide (TPR) repeat protein